jgi:hypothetical protein
MESEPERPRGSLLFADPAGATFPPHVHTFNEPYDRNNTGPKERHGIDSITGRMVNYQDLTGYTTGEGQWAAMNRKRGTIEPENE